VSSIHLSFQRYISRNMHASRIKHCCLAAARLHQLLWTPHLHTPTCLASYRSASVQSHNVETAYSSQPVQHVEQVPVPMCRRQAQHTEQVSVLVQWRQHVLDEISNVREGFAAADGGPSDSELQVQEYPTPTLPRAASLQPTGLPHSFTLTHSNALTVPCTASF
jgi:hypothetical protein